MSGCTIFLAILASGCVGSPNGFTDGESSPLEAGGLRTSEVFTFSDEGKLPPGYGNGDQVCTVFPISLPGYSRWFDLQVPGVVTNVTVTATWDPAPEGAERLRLFFGPTTPVDLVIWTKMVEPVVEVTGTSPLVLQINDTRLSYEEYALVVGWDCKEPATVGVAQEFRIEGSIDHHVEAGTSG